MRKELSTRYTWVYRWLIPGLLTVFAIAVLWVNVISKDGPPDNQIFLFSILFVTGAVIVARLFDRAKRVYITDQSIIFAAYGKEHAMNLDELAEVNETTLFRPHRICMTFISPTAFGTKIVFFPPLSINHWFSEHPCTKDLQALVKKTK
ncbi:MAG: hypothetical protein ACR2QG_05855 [Gammaproteobacteria bacterium]